MTMYERTVRIQVEAKQIVENDYVNLAIATWCGGLYNDKEMTVFVGGRRGFAGHVGDWIVKHDNNYFEHVSNKDFNRDYHEIKGTVNVLTAPTGSYREVRQNQ